MSDSTSMPADADVPLPAENIPPDDAAPAQGSGSAPRQDTLGAPADQGGTSGGDTIGAGAPGDDSTRKDPSEWTTGDEPMTGAQRSYLDTLAREAGEQIGADLTKAEASEHIERLQAATGRD